jgi:hypothetical protein
VAELPAISREELWLAVQSRALGAAAEGCDALVATGVMPAGAWR